MTCEAKSVTFSWNTNRSIGAVSSFDEEYGFVVYNIMVEPWAPHFSHVMIH